MTDIDQALLDPTSVFRSPEDVLKVKDLTREQKIEFLRFEPGTSVEPPVRTMPHFAFKTDDLKRDIEGENVILGPFDPMENLTVVFIEKDGAVFEFMEFRD